MLSSKILSSKSTSLLYKLANLSFFNLINIVKVFIACGLVKFHFFHLISCFFYIHLIILISWFLSSFFFVFLFYSLSNCLLWLWLRGFIILWIFRFTFNFHRFFWFFTNSLGFIVRFVMLFISWPLFRLNWRRSLCFFFLISVIWSPKLILFLFFLRRKWKVNFLLLLSFVFWYFM